MNVTDIAAIVFACVTANHLGLTGALEKVIRHELPVINCPKCASFWGVLIYGLASMIGPAAGLSGDGASATHPSALPRLLALSLLCSYLALWLELAEGFIDRLYDYVYEQIYPTADTTDDDTQRAEGTVSGMRSAGSTPEGGPDRQEDGGGKEDQRRR